MDTASLLSLALACAPQVHADTALSLVRVESALNPWAIGVVGGALRRQPRHRAEALAIAHALKAAGWNFSVGLAQINVRNWPRLGLTLSTAFEPCSNLAAMQAVLTECFERAERRSAGEQQALRRALSCYYSGNFTTGFRHGYVQRVTAAAAGVRAPHQVAQQPALQRSARLPSPALTASPSASLSVSLPTASLPKEPS